MWPRHPQVKHLPSCIRFCFSAGVSFLISLDCPSVIVTSTSMASGSRYLCLLVGFHCSLNGTLSVLFPRDADIMFFRWISFLSACCHSLIVTGVWSLFRMVKINLRSSPFLKYSMDPCAVLSHPPCWINHSNVAMYWSASLPFMLSLVNSA